jgi:hypothetical protein
MPGTINQAYLYDQLISAIRAGNLDRAGRWRDVMAGLETGELDIGGRAPVRGVPVWVTPEVVRGGFATTALAAGGDLLPHETALARSLGLAVTSASSVRQHLNAWYVSDAGLETLRTMAGSGHFEAQVPEETALLTVAVLMPQDPVTALKLLSAIAPFFDRLRFYPIPADTPPGEGVFVRTAGQVRDQLAAKTPRADIVKQHRTLTVLLPLKDRLMDLLSDLDDPDWTAKAGTWLADYRAAAAEPLPRRWRRSNGRFQQAYGILTVLHRTGSFDHGMVYELQDILREYWRKYHSPGERAALRRAQAAQQVEVWFDKLGPLVANRLKGLTPGFGIPEPEYFTGPVTLSEAVQGAPAGTVLPESFLRKIRSAQVGDIETLVRTGMIKGPETLARVLPLMTADVHALGFTRDEETHVFRALWRAFASRRSLLLFDLQSQVKLKELPWAKVLLARRTTGAGTQALARQMFSDMAILSLRHFPQVMFPNRLVEELEALAKLAGIEVSLTREVAADIFMGHFSDRFVRAAQAALTYYQGTTYARYYDLPAPVHPLRLTEICRERAGHPDVSCAGPAINGMIIEQQQILTSHNLAQVLAHVEKGGLDFAEMALRCFRWICRTQQQPCADWQAVMQRTKRAAYAWRQMVAFVSELPVEGQEAVLLEISETAARQSADFRRVMEPALEGLICAVTGEVVTQKDQVFLGWADGPSHPFALWGSAPNPGV